jgi:predicted SAM-dependent methyltransferase
MSQRLSKNKIIYLKTELRLCECCGGGDLELMWTSKSVVVRKINTWEFPVNISICRDCGFCFSSPSPNNDDLMKYHEDGNVGFKGGSLPYSIDERLRILNKYKVPDGIFVEIGGDDPGEFHQKCSRYFSQLISIEVTQELKNKSININSLKESVDVITHYDVLEHVLDVKHFLSNCYDALKRGGVMICEVPNLKLYPDNLLLQEFEHVNHFTISSLSMIAEKAGFNLIEFDDICSRPYGFVAIFRKDDSNKDYNKKNINEFSEARESVIGGLKQIDINNIQLLSVRKKISQLTKDNKKIILWGVTDLLRSLLNDYKISDQVMVVDSDPRRKDDLIMYGVKLGQPIKYIN